MSAVPTKKVARSPSSDNLVQGGVLGAPPKAVMGRHRKSVQGPALLLRSTTIPTAIILSGAIELNPLPQYVLPASRSPDSAASCGSDVHGSSPARDRSAHL